MEETVETDVFVSGGMVQPQEPPWKHGLQASTWHWYHTTKLELNYIADVLAIRYGHRHPLFHLEINLLQREPI